MLYNYCIILCYIVLCYIKPCSFSYLPLHVRIFILPVTDADGRSAWQLHRPSVTNSYESSTLGRPRTASAGATATTFAMLPTGTGKFNGWKRFHILNPKQGTPRRRWPAICRGAIRENTFTETGPESTGEMSKRPKEGWSFRRRETCAGRTKSWWTSTWSFFSKKRRRTGRYGNMIWEIGNIECCRAFWRSYLSVFILGGVGGSKELLSRVASPCKRVAVWMQHDTSRKAKYLRWTNSWRHDAGCNS